MTSAESTSTTSEWSSTAPTTTEPPSTSATANIAAPATLASATPQENPFVTFLRRLFGFGASNDNKSESESTSKTATYTSKTTTSSAEPTRRPRSLRIPRHRGGFLCAASGLAVDSLIS